ncbi:hypothetical protein N2152v2_003984 [Parachlorella kessleri]
MMSNRSASSAFLASSPICSLPSKAPRRGALLVAAIAAPEAPQQAVSKELADDDIVIVSACRTALTRASKGGFKDTPPDDLVAAVLKETLARTGVKAEEIGDVVVGSCLAPSAKRHIECRQAMFEAGFPYTVPVATVNRQCASGLQAIADIAGEIKLGTCRIGIAAGMEHMTSGGLDSWQGSTNPRVEENQWAKDCELPMGFTSENVAERFGVPREAQDKVAASSNAKAKAAQEAGKFKEEIVPVEVNWKDPVSGEVKKITVDADDGIRPQYTTPEKLKKLPAVFKKGGTTTVGNASQPPGQPPGQDALQVTDGAAAVMLTTRGEAKRRGLPILGTLRTYAVVGVEPAVMGIGPSEAVPKALEQAGLQTEDVAVFELNEAFGSQAAYVLRKLGLDEGPLAERVNPNGGAIALGHPIGCTGVRQTVTLLHELNRRKDGKYGVVSMCTGTGMGAAAVFEYESAGGEGK